MTDGEPARQAERLRRAAIEVLAAAGQPDDEIPDPLASALERLRDALQAELPQPVPNEHGLILDPYQHFLSMPRYTGSVAEPVTLTQMAADLRRQLDNDRGLDDPPEDNVIVTELRGLIIGSLLKELAARVTPGAAFGPGMNGAALARVALDLSRELFKQTFLE